jgi:hypothetical protein
VYFTHFKDNCVYRMTAGEAPVPDAGGKQRLPISPWTARASA